VVKRGSVYQKSVEKNKYNNLDVDIATQLEPVIVPAKDKYLPLMEVLKDSWYELLGPTVAPAEHCPPSSPEPTWPCTLSSS
jgi:hypothetical protein